MKKQTEIAIVIPSHKRADRITTHRLLPNNGNVYVCIPESQEKDYREKNPDMNILVHPDSIIGISPKRQWIYDKFGDVFMIDDDIQKISCVYNDKSTSLNPDEFYEVIQSHYHTCKNNGIYLFGFTSNANPLMYDVFEPIKFSGVIMAGAIGLLKNPHFKFDPEAPNVDDYLICGINAFYYRKALIDTRFCAVPFKTFHNEGGLSEYRSLETEKHDTIYLRKKFGEALNIKKNTAKAKVFHQYQRTLTIPF